MGGHLHSDPGSDLPPNVQEWIDKNVIQLRDVLANPETRARLLALLDEPTTRLGTDDEYR